MEPSDKPKKKVGRPKKNAIITSKRHGIQKNPTNPQNIYEIVIDTSEIFKNIASVCKAYTVEDIMIIHNPTRTYLIIEGSDSTFEGVEITIEGSNCYWYYVREPISYTMSIVELKSIFNGIKKSEYGNITWVSNSLTKTVFIIENVDTKLKKGIISKDNLFVDGITPRDVFDYDYIHDDKFEIKFTYPSSILKNKISIYKLVTDRFNIERENTDTICFSYISGTSSLKNKTVLEKEMISIIDKVPPGIIKSLPIDINKIEPFINISLSDYIDIKIIDNDIIFIYNIDNLCIVKMKMSIVMFTM